MNSRLPCALENWENLTQNILKKQIILILDYDGTLAPIASVPSLSLLSENKKYRLAQLSQLYSVIVVSGRTLQEQINLIGLDNIYYICNHGYEIRWPQPQNIFFQKGEEFIAKINNAYQELTTSLANIKGIFIEHKKISLSIHFRLVEKVLVKKIEAVVNAIVKNSVYLSKHYAKKVFEIRPNIDWDTGKAIGWLTQTLNVDKENVSLVYIGDDVTDEPAFNLVSNFGVSILVANYYRPTFANYCLQNTEAVWEFLDRLIVAKNKEIKT